MHDKVFNLLRWFIALDTRNTLRVTRFTQWFANLTNLPSRWLLWGAFGAQAALGVWRDAILAPDRVGLVLSAVFLVVVGTTAHLTSQRPWSAPPDPESEATPLSMVPVVVLAAIGTPLALAYGAIRTGVALLSLLHDVSLAVPLDPALAGLATGLGDCLWVSVVYLARTPPIDPLPRQRRVPNGQRV